MRWTRNTYIVNPNGPETCILNTEFQGVAQAQATNGTPGPDIALLAKLTESLSVYVTELSAMRARLDNLEENWGKQGGTDPRK